MLNFVTAAFSQNAKAVLIADSLTRVSLSPYLKSNTYIVKNERL